MTATDTATWLIQGGRLAFCPRPGTVLFPSAREIWSSVFAEGGEVNGVSLKPLPSEFFGDLEFSRFPAEPVLLLTGNILEGLSAALAVEANGAVAPFPWAVGADPIDQVIVDRCWYPLDSDALATALELLQKHGIVPGGKINLGQLIWLRSSPDVSIKLIDRADDSPAASGHHAAANDVPIHGLHGELYPYQRDGVSFLRLVAAQGLGCILGDEMGLGKTLQVIALVQAEVNAGRAPALVIAPATLLENWRRELTEFAPRLTVLIHSGPRRFGAAHKLSVFDVVVTSYETAVRDEPMLSSIQWNVIATDEAQNIKNPDAQRTMAVKRLPRRVSIAVTGTPVENRLSDLWSLSDFALPGLLGEIEAFRAEFDDTATDASRLAPVVAPILLRRRVSEVAEDLPPRIDIPQCVAMGRTMAEGYEQLREQALAEYGAAAGLVSLQKLRMYCSHPRLIDGGAGDPSWLMPKYQRLLEILDEVFSKGEKALVFSSYTGIADILMADLPARFAGAHFDWIDGRVPVEERQLKVDRLTGFDGAGVLVLNPKAAGVGLNITAANHVIHYNPEWNPAVEDQASARAYRRKQTRPVTVHHLYFADSVEEVIISRLNFKRQLSDEAAVGHKGDATTADVARALAMSPLSKCETSE